MALLSSKQFYKRHSIEVNKHVFENQNTLIISNIESNFKLENKDNLDFIEIKVKNNFHKEINKINSSYDLIILSDVLEVSEDIVEVLNSLKKHLNHDGKILISSINPIWNMPLKLLETLKIKKYSKNRAYIHLNKFSRVLSSLGFYIVMSKSRQYFPFKLFFVGSFINTLLEIIFYFLNLGIRTYILIKEDTTTNPKQNKSKTIIIPAKNEEGNLVELVERIPFLGEDTEAIISCGSSKDDTLRVANSLVSNHLDIKVIEQSKTGKANAVWEALNIASGDLVAILDADISVDPEELTEFFDVIESNRADFVNGTRLIYPMEKGSMRLINNLGNRAFQLLITLIIRLPLTDSLCGTKVFKRDLYEKIKLWQKTIKVEDPFGDFDLLFSAAYSGEKIVELPIHYRTRKYGKTQISRFKDGFKLIRYLIKSFYKFNSSI